MCPEQHVQGNYFGAYFAYENVKVDVAAAAVGVVRSSCMLLHSCVVLLLAMLLLLLLLLWAINYQRFVFVDFPFHVATPLTLSHSLLFMLPIINNNNNCCLICGIYLYVLDSVRWKEITFVIIADVAVVIVVAAAPAAKNAITNCFCFCDAAVIVVAAAAHFNTTFEFVAAITRR